mmetsp:Transcript_82535/g.151101  ORF Transcript_82535/g.151101 Transcript_82535/m.151101 type:complete len:237 (-) Transcript_82535:318-1028(-)
MTPATSLTTGCLKATNPAQHAIHSHPDASPIPRDSTRQSPLPGCCWVCRESSCLGPSARGSRKFCDRRCLDADHFSSSGTKKDKHPQCKVRTLHPIAYHTTSAASRAWAHRERGLPLGKSSVWLLGSGLRDTRNYSPIVQQSVHLNRPLASQLVAAPCDGARHAFRALEKRGLQGPPATARHQRHLPPDYGWPRHLQRPALFLCPLLADRRDAGGSLPSLPAARCRQLPENGSEIA